jgi:dolichol-phosphate mannosyltransferase
VPQDQAPRFSSALELAVVIPTYSERQNISPLLAGLESALGGTDWEAIFVDDNSPDGTAEYIRQIALTNRKVRVLERVGRRGLSSACIEGILATPAPFIAIMDGDLQHDAGALPKMLAVMKSKELDIVVASRRSVGGSMGEMNGWRTSLSNLGTRVSRLVCRCDISDPMSGFFLVNRVYFQQVVHRLTGTGFKILVDILASSPRPVSIGEVPYHFRPRLCGQSKLDANAELEYLYLLVDKVVGGRIPTRFIVFVIVGSLGLLVHLGILASLYYWTHVDFGISQAVGTIVAMTLNFFLNNVVTFRDRRLRGWRVAAGLVTFYLACSIGVLINISFADFLLSSRIPWYAAGLAGMTVSSVWNFGVTRIFTWRRNQSVLQSVLHQKCETSSSTQERVSYER